MVSGYHAKRRNFSVKTECVGIVDTAFRFALFVQHCRRNINEFHRFLTAQSGSDKLMGLAQTDTRRCEEEAVESSYLLIVNLFLTTA